MSNLYEQIHAPNARATITHARPKHTIDGKPAYYQDGVLVEGHKFIDSPIGPVVDPETVIVLDIQEITNLKTNAGMDFLHSQTYGTSGLGANGLNYVALSNDTVTETSASTTLSNEITTNGLARAQGSVAHTAGTTVTTIQKTFTATGNQSCQKAALFTAASAGTMNHVLAFTPRALASGDTIQVTYTITIS